jgi:hypothetical protein
MDVRAIIIPVLVSLNFEISGFSAISSYPSGVRLSRIHAAAHLSAINGKPTVISGAEG